MRCVLTTFLIIASLTVADEYNITMLNPLDILTYQDNKISSDLLGKSINEIYGQIKEVRLYGIFNNGKPVTNIEDITERVREKIDNAKFEGRFSETPRSMVPWVSGHLLLKGGRIVQIEIMQGGIVVDGDLLFGESVNNKEADAHD
ncbi:MAG: hypothetical protein GXY61_03815 [Lentisphaerae bacterium]|nr:hypothetical protein [Lentisphaerota bacterium]